MTNADTIMTGSFVFACLIIALGIPLSIYTRIRTKDPWQRSENFKLTWLLVLIAGVCMWLMWLCCFLHQMNPIVTPLIDD